MKGESECGRFACECYYPSAGVLPSRARGRIVNEPFGGSTRNRVNDKGEGAKFNLVQSD